MSTLGKRQMERFDLNVPAFITLKDDKDPDSKLPLEFRTRNICAGGAFVVTDSPFQIGTRVDVGLQLAFFTGNVEYERRSAVRVSGAIIRVETGGMAIQFDDKFQISPVLKDA